MIALEGVNGESLVNLFRTLSQRRRHGVVSISHGDSHYEVLFHDGKIVGAASGDLPMVHAIMRRLKRAGLYNPVELPDHVEHSPGAEPGQIDVLREAIKFIRENYPAVAIEDFVRAKQAAEIDLLHLLSSIEEASARFDPQGIQIDPAVSISMSPGQLLLDLVDLSEERRRLAHIAEVAEPEDLTLRKTSAAPPAGLSQAELGIWNAIVEDMTLGELFDRLLISRHAVCERLFSLVDRGGAEFGPPKLKTNGFHRPISDAARSGAQQSAGAEAQRNSGDLFQALDNSNSGLDDEIGDLSLFSELPSDPPAGTDAGLRLAAEDQPKDYSTLREVISAIDRSSEILRNVAGGAFGIPESEDDGPEDFQAESVEADEAEPNQVEAKLDEMLDADPEFEKALFGSVQNNLPPIRNSAPVTASPVLRQDAQFQPAQARRSISFRWNSQFELRDLNFFLLDPQNAQLISLCISLVFLVSILILGYPLLDSWFDRLADFTLNVQ